MRKRLFMLGPIAILLIALITFAGGEIVLHLWNWLTPALFGWHQISFWQALGLLVLCRILFGGVSGRGLHRSNFRERMRARWTGRWDRMTPEEREKFRERMRGRCGFPPAAGETKEPA
jgi:hypothetical protein